jgi:CRP-like cAMP-binding protein
VREGDDDRDLLLLVEGTAEVRSGRKWLNALEEGDFFGEIALVAGGPRTATVTATADATLLVLEETAFRALLDRLPRVRGKLLQAVAERLVHEAI